MSLLRELYYRLKPYTTVRINSGERRSRPVLRRKPSGKMRFTCIFDKSCEYILSPQAHHPYNRLCGVSYPESLNTEIFIGWRYDSNVRRYEVAIISRVDGVELITKSPVKSWPKSNSAFDVVFKPSKTGDCFFVYVTRPRGSDNGLMEVVDCNVDLSSTLQIILYPRFNAGQGAPQNLLIRIKHGKA